MVRRITQRLHWPRHDHEQKLQTWSEPALPVVKDPAAQAPPPDQNAGSRTPPWILPPVARAQQTPETRP